MLPQEKEDRKRGRKRRGGRGLNDCIWDHEVERKPFSSALVSEIHENSKRKRGKREEGGEAEGKKEERVGWLVASATV